MKYFRITIYIAGRECVGQWREFDLTDLLKDCTAFALNDCAYLVEFKTVDDETVGSLGENEQ